MVRFTSPEDTGFQRLLGELTRWEGLVTSASKSQHVVGEHNVATDAADVVADDSARPCHYIPFPKNKRFVGREETLHQLRDMFFVQEETQKIAVVGLGGVGKTQVALKFAYWVKDNKPEYSIFWVPALSRVAFEQAYVEMASKLPIRKRSEDEDLKESVRRYLSSEAAGPWLLIVDNADDIDLFFGPSDKPGGLNEYLPESEDGLVLFTTRSREVAVAVARNSVTELLEMDPQEAADYLKKSLIRSSGAGTAELLKELTYLPLAITQAAAYLNTTGVPITEYLRLLRGAEDTASLMSREFHDDTRYRGSPNAVATTWLVSFDQICKSDGAAADLLSFMSCIEPKGIPQSILPRFELEEQMVHAVGTLCGYGFLTRRGDSKIFDMHSLVHLATRIWIQGEGRTATIDEKATRHLATVFPDDDYTNCSLWREYLPHAFRVLQHSEGLDMEERSNLCFWVGRCLRVDGRIKEAVRYVEEACQWRNSHFAEDHPSRLASQHTLAGAYNANGQVKEAITLLEQVVAIKAETFAEDHPSRLASQHELAGAYNANGQVKEAIALLEQVVTIKAETLAEDHPSRLASQHVLAMAYKANGQVKEAVALLEQVVAIRAETLAEDHPDRLASQQWLTYILQQADLR
ncbi:P-loop containing nucleoside triphosphate hydrolase protein [Chaetomium strumarium]|uniref:P-loop containing nucleoside triphosphate hydrolase protein n=1 Tax=Chaetomium strumarium TaxID=1170767 RepID=A0AAJ0M111_9PEZI|nr:P-loop containing nucleoside triphosphate hydrolase protein [Chaetomium strumarium]